MGDSLLSLSFLLSIFLYLFRSFFVVLLGGVRTYGRQVALEVRVGFRFAGSRCGHGGHVAMELFCFRLLHMHVVRERFQFHIAWVLE